MPKLKLKKENKDVVDGWMGTYGDMVTLLMAFFVMLYSASDPDPGKYEEIVESMKEAFTAEKTENEFKELEEELNDIIGIGSSPARDSWAAATCSRFPTHPGGLQPQPIVRNPLPYHAQPGHEILFALRYQIGLRMHIW